jgi:subtilisin family serine protease
MVSRRHSVVLLAAAMLSLTASSLAAPAHESFVVVLHPGTRDVPAVAASLARQAGGQVGFVYEDALQGFSLTAPAAAARGLAKNPNVAYVEADRLFSIQAQEMPTGIERTFADVNANLGIDGQDDYRVDVDVAVIDTGIDLQHSDLNVVSGVTCTSRWIWRPAICSVGGDDDHYHGTHVAGTIGALDNDLGVVGMAPGARLHAVKVLNSQGSGYTSWIVAGIDWVAANASTIEVANMSLGGAGFSQAEYDAIQGAVDKGVAFAVAAGNSDDDASYYSPGGFDNVLSVSALADFDGLPGGLVKDASSYCRPDQDDTLADFSNWGTAIDIAAPGVCITSTYPVEKGEYGTISGTSMASPHAAGALALLASTSNHANATDVASLYSHVINAGNSNWTDDSGDGIKEPLLDVNTFDATLVPGSGGGGGGEPPANQAPTASFTHSCSGLDCTFTSTADDSDGTIVSYSWAFGDSNASTAQNPIHTYSSDGTYMVTLTVTDDDDATDSDIQTVTVTSGTTPPTTTLSGSSTSQGRTWTAIATYTGQSGTYSGTWSDGTSDTCTIGASGGSCFVEKPGLAKKVASVTYTDSGDLGWVVITKP